MNTSPDDDFRLSAEEALGLLVEGNERFLRGEARTSAFRRETLADLAKAQRPYATILGCSDSRVPPEWIFDAGLGELFVVRVAGNILSPEIAGSLQYAGAYLQTPLFVVLGHEGCGAVGAAIATKLAGELFRSRVQLLLASIVPGLPDFDEQLTRQELLSRAVESNVRRTVRLILDSPEGQARLAEDRVRIVGAVYEIETGRGKVLISGRTRLMHWDARNTIAILEIGKRLAAVLLVVAVYYLAAGLVIQSFELEVLRRGSIGSLMNSLLLGLLLSFRNQAAYGRWWEARGLWGKLTNDCRNLAAKCAAFVPAEALADSRVAAILVSFPVALNRRLRDEPCRLQDLPGFERDVADPSHVPLELANRLFAEIARWSRDGHISEAGLWVLDAHARGLLDVCGGCEKIRYTPLPPAYKVLLRGGLVANVVFAPWLIVPEDGLWSLPAVLLVCFFLFGVELIDSVVEQPFGRDRNDLDLDRYCLTIRDGVEACLPAIAPAQPPSSKP